MYSCSSVIHQVEAEVEVYFQLTWLAKIRRGTQGKPNKMDMAQDEIKKYACVRVHI